MSNEHTPGPLRISYDDGYADIYADDGHERIARVFLLAAAPGLLAALEDLLGECDITITSTSLDDHAAEYACRWCGRDYSPAMTGDEVPNFCESDDCPGVAARTAIAKAKGELT